jgi:hypothetical protein
MLTSARDAPAESFGFRDVLSLAKLARSSKMASRAPVAHEPDLLA